MSRRNYDSEMSLAEWEPGNVGSLFNRQAIRSCVFYPLPPRLSSPRLAKGKRRMTGSMNRLDQREGFVKQNRCLSPRR